MTEINKGEVSYFSRSSTLKEDYESLNTRPLRPIWKSALPMVGSLLVAIAFALGHHFLYASFDGRALAGSIGLSWLIRIGTGMAFAVQSFLVLATSTAYVQRQWFAIGKKPYTIRQLDAITGVLGDPLNFWRASTWARVPDLLVLAAIVWLVPLIAVVTPGTMTVVARPTNEVTLEKVPQFLFDEHQWASIFEVGDFEIYLNPATDVSRITTASAMSHQTMSLKSSFTNSSYSSTFFAPTIKCIPANSSVISAIGDAMTNHDLEKDTRLFLRSEVFMAFVPGNETIQNTVEQIPNITGPELNTLDNVSLDMMRLYVLPNTTVSRFSDPSLIIANWKDTVECQLHNASYQVDFRFAYPSQTHNITSLQILNPVAATMFPSNGSGISKPVSTFDAARMSYMSLMAAFARLLVGWSISSTTPGLIQSFQTSWQLLGIDWTSRETTIQGLETLFQNITISLLSVNSLLRPNEQTESSPVLNENLHNIFHYDPTDLWISYGVAIFCVICCVLLGSHALWRNNGAFYSNQFSTFVRTSKFMNLDGVLDAVDDGTSPLPKKLGEAKVMLRRQRELEPSGSRSTQQIYSLVDVKI